jgi:hypothetical protein
MDNFDLKKYLAEGKLHENKEPTIRAKEFWQDADYIQSLKDDNYSDVAEWILNNWIGNMSASEFLKSWDGFIEVTGTEGGDSDVLESMLDWHVEKGYMTAEEAAQVMLMYWDPDGTDYTEEDKEEVLKHFKNG